MEIQEIERVPLSGRVIIAVNHRSWMDPPLMAFAVFQRGRFARFLAKRELFQNPLAGWFLRSGGAIELDRSRGDVGAIRSGISVLENEGCMVLFPEGTRSRTGLPGRPKPGVGFLAYQTSAPVVPARVWDTERFPRRASMRVKFGPPLQYQGDGTRESFQKFAEQVMETILNL